MKMITKLLALCLALALLCGVALADPLDPDTVVMSVGDQQYTALNLDNMAYMLYSDGYSETYPDYDMAVEALIQNTLYRLMIEDGGYNNFTAEETQAFENEANATWDKYLDNYVNYYLSEDTDEAREQLRGQAVEFFNSQGLSLDDLIEELESQAASERLQNDLTQGYEPTEAEINEIFDQLAPLYQAEFENNVGSYEIYIMQTGNESLYVPEGYRAIIHILLEVDSDLLDAYMSAQNALEEAESAEEPDEAAIAAARQTKDDALAAVLASRQDVIDEIYDRLEKGESFQTLIAEYGTDPGMQQEEMLKTGYLVHKDSIRYDSAFTEGAFQEGMQQPGDVSQPVVGQFGIHILYYLDDVPGGAIMTDSVHDEIAEVLVSQNLNTALNAAFEEWENKVEIVKNDELIDQMKADAAAQEEAE